VEFDARVETRLASALTPHNSGNITPEVMELAGLAVKALRGGVSLRCSLLHELSCANGNAVGKQFAAALLSKRNRSIAPAPGLAARISAATDNFMGVGQALSRNAHQRMVKDLTGALMLAGWLRKAVSYAKESVLECMYYPRAMDTVANSLACYMKGNECAPVDDVAPLEVGPMEVDMEEVGIHYTEEDYKDYEVGDASETDSSSESEDELFSVYNRIKAHEATLESCVQEGGLSAMRMQIPDVKEDTVDMDGFGNPVMQQTKEGQAATRTTGVDVAGVNAICERYSGFYVGTVMDSVIPRYASTARAVRAMLLGESRRILTTPGLHMALGAIGTAGMFVNDAFCTNFLPIMCGRSTEILDIAVGLGMHEILSKIWKESAGGGASERTYKYLRSKHTFVSDNRSTNFILESESGYAMVAASSVTSVASSMHTIISRSNYRVLMPDANPWVDQDEKEN
jgi:hypothetical protein